MTSTSKSVASELKIIREDLEYIKQHMVDIDSIMTEDDYESLQKYREDKKSGKLSSHEQLKKELGL